MMAHIRDAYTARELSSPLGKSKRAVITQADREGWPSRPRSGRGGGKEYPLESLPQEIRQAIRAALAKDATAALTEEARVTRQLTQNARQTSSTDFPRLPRSSQRRAKARAAIVSAFEQWRSILQITLVEARVTFAAAYSAGEITVAPWVREAVPAFHFNSLRNWQEKISQEGVSSLAGVYGKHRKGKGIIDATEGMADTIIGCIAEKHEIHCGNIMLGLKARFRTLPDMRTLQRWLARWKVENEQVLLKIQNPDGWRSKFQSAAGNASEAVTYPNELWEMDSSPTDIILADGKRHTLIGCIDVFSRRAVLHLARTSNSAGVCSLLRRSLLLLGVPTSIKLDNGTDYQSEQVQSAIYNLDVLPSTCPVFSPEKKPHIEAFFRTFQHGLVEMLPGYIGHSVADRKAIESRKSFAQRIAGKKGQKPALAVPLTAEEFQTFCDDWLATIYQERKHSGLGCSPNDKVAGADIVTIADERALDVLLLPIAGKGGLRMVGKKGIRATPGVYNSPLLGGLEGQEVLVKLDDADAGYIYVFTLDHMFICRAEDPALTGVSRRDLAKARKTRQKALLNAQVKEIKKIVARTKPHELVKEIMAQARVEADAAQATRQAPVSAAQHSTPALEQAALAAASREAYTPAPATAAEEAARAAFEARYFTDIPKPDPETTLQDLTGREAFWMALKLEEKLRNRESLRPEQTKFLHGYQSTHFYQSWRAQYDRVGESLFDGIEVAVAL